MTATRLGSDPLAMFSLSGLSGSSCSRRFMSAFVWDSSWICTHEGAVVLVSGTSLLASTNSPHNGDSNGYCNIIVKRGITDLVFCGVVDPPFSSS